MPTDVRFLWLLGVATFMLDVTLMQRRARKLKRLGVFGALRFGWYRRISQDLADYTLLYLAAADRRDLEAQRPEPEGHGPPHRVGVLHQQNTDTAIGRGGGTVRWLLGAASDGMGHRGRHPARERGRGRGH